MAKTKVHVIDKSTGKAVCGNPAHFQYVTPYCRETITCTKCRKSKAFKELPSRGA